MTDVSRPSAARPASTAPPTVPKDLSDFLVELSVAMHRRAMYPGGHPSLATAEQRVMQRLGPLLASQSSIAVGVARDQLVIDGVATDSRNHLLKGLAQRLHSHRLAGFRFLAGIATDEVTGFLERLARDPEEQTREPLTVPGSTASLWQHISVYRQSYDRLELVDEEDAGLGPRAHPRAAQLWLELAQAAMAAEEGGGSASVETDPGEVAKAINSRAREAAYEQAVVGYLLQIADELRTTDSPDTQLLRSRVSRLVRELSPEAVNRLLEMGGNLAQRRNFLVDASEGMATEAVLTLTVAAAEVSQQAISRPLLRLLTKLANHARQGSPAGRSDADVQFREHVREMINNWNLADPTSIAYGKVLDRLTNPAQEQGNVPGITQMCEPERTVEMCLEVRNAAPPLWDAIDAMIARGDIIMLLDTLDATPPDNPLPGVIRTRIATPENFARLLELPAVDPRRTEEFARRVGVAGTNVLLDALAVSQSRATRRKLLDVLGKLGDGIGPAVVARFSGAPWYIQRNLLLLMSGLTQWPDDFSPVPFAGHDDVRVRREALRLMLKRPATRDAAITSAVGDADPQIVRFGLDASQRDCPAAAVPRLVQRISMRTLPADLQVLAVRALNSTSAPAALPCLLELASTHTRWLRRERVAPKSSVALAALTGLAARWSTEPQVARLLARAVRSADPEIRAAAAATQSAA